jgi:hypothetical protein
MVTVRKAVIGGNIPPIASVIDHGRDGLLADHFRHQNMAAAINSSCF